MMILKLTKYEFYKLFKKKYPLVIIVICLLVMTVPLVIYNRNMAKNENTMGVVDNQKKVFDEYKGELTEDKYDEIYEIINSESNNPENQAKIASLQSIYTQMEYILQQQKKALNVVDLISENIYEQEARGENKNIYELRYNKKIFNYYNVERNFLITNTRGWESLLRYPSAIYFSLSYFLSIIVVAAVLFSLEYEGGTDRIISSSKYGRGKMLYAKIITLIMSIIIISALYFTILLLIFIKNYDMSGFMSSIHILSGYSNSPYNLSFAGLYFLKAGLMSLIALLLSLVTGYLCTIFKNIIMGTGVSLVFASFFYFANSIIEKIYNTASGIRDYSNYNIYVINKIFNLVSLSDSEWFFIELRVKNIFNFPVEAMFINLFLIIIISLIMSLLLFIKFKRISFVRYLNVKI